MNPASVEAHNPASAQPSRESMEGWIRDLAARDPEFRRRLIDEPRATLEGKFGVAFPPAWSIEVLQETRERHFLVLPEAPSVPPQAKPTVRPVEGGLLDPESYPAARAHERLTTSIVIWLTTVSASGAPRPVPVWFWWDGRSALIYSPPDKPKLSNIARSPQVSLNLDGDGLGSGIVCLHATARTAPDQPPADRHPQFVEKYRALMDQSYGSPAGFASKYSVPIVVTPHRIQLIG